MSEPKPSAKVSAPLAEAARAHRAAFDAMTPAERDAHVEPIRTALLSLHAQTAPMRTALASLAEQSEKVTAARRPVSIVDALPADNPLARMAEQAERNTSILRRTLAPTLQRHAETFRRIGEPIREALAAAEKAQAVERAVIAAAPRDQRPHVRRALRSLFRNGMTVPDVEAALAAVHDYLTANTFGRLFPEGRAWGLAWAFARIIRGESLAGLDLIAQDRNRLPSGRSLRNRGERFQVLSQRGRPERRDRFARRSVPLSSHLAAHAPPRSGAFTGGVPTHHPYPRPEKATA